MTIRSARAFLLSIPLLLSACTAHHALYPVAFPSIAVQCLEMRAVACVGMESSICEEYVHAAVHEINVAVGRSVFHYVGEYEMSSGQRLYDSGVYVVGYGNLAHMGNETLGVTFTGTEEGSACISHVLTALDRTWTRSGVIDFHVVLVHELIHGLGYDHASPNSSWHSIMEAHYRDGGHITDLDREALRAVYNR